MAEGLHHPNDGNEVSPQNVPPESVLKCYVLIHRVTFLLDKIKLMAVCTTIVILVFTIILGHERCEKGNLPWVQMWRVLDSLNFGTCGEGGG